MYLMIPVCFLIHIMLIGQKGERGDAGPQRQQTA